jgi:hypothetical protein
MTGLTNLIFTSEVISGPKGRHLSCSKTINPKEDSMDEKKQENTTRLGMRDHIRERLDYLQTHDNNATIPLLAIEVALHKVQTEFQEIIDGWKLQATN